MWTVVSKKFIHLNQETVAAAYAALAATKDAVCCFCGTSGKMCPSALAVSD